MANRTYSVIIANMATFSGNIYHNSNRQFELQINSLASYHQALNKKAVPLPPKQ
jgi:hypothetical protein